MRDRVSSWGQVSTRPSVLVAIGSFAAILVFQLWISRNNPPEFISSYRSSSTHSDDPRRASVYLSPLTVSTTY